MTDIDTSDPVLRKIRALLNQAENAGATPEEQKAFFAKAQALMTKHSIDEALLAATQPAGMRGTAEVIYIKVARGPYQTPQRILLDYIAKANGCKTIGEKYNDHIRHTVVGFAADLQFVEQLYTSCLVQAAGEMASAPIRARRDAESMSPAGKVAWNNAFMWGYGREINRRLLEQRAATIAEQPDAPGVALVLRDRSIEVADKFKDLFPRIRTGRVSAGSHGGSGASHGRAAAGRANLGQRGVSGSRGAIGR